jgi:hypothetical protein
MTARRRCMQHMQAALSWEYVQNSNWCGLIYKRTYNQ